MLGQKSGRKIAEVNLPSQPALGWHQTKNFNQLGDGPGISHQVHRAPVNINIGGPIISRFFSATRHLEVQASIAPVPSWQLGSHTCVLRALGEQARKHASTNRVPAINSSSSSSTSSCASLQILAIVLPKHDLLARPRPGPELTWPALKSFPGCPPDWTYVCLSFTLPSSLQSLLFLKLENYDKSPACPSPPFVSVSFQSFPILPLLPCPGRYGSTGPGGLT